MAFQFLCPRGHLLEGDESQSGEQLQCPYCQTVFVVPAPDFHPPASSGESGQSFSLETARDSTVVHILCPRGHELETPREMIGKHAMCPHCQTEFQLRLEDSREYQRDQAAEQERRQRRLGKAWMNWTIAMVVIVVLGVGLLIALTMSR